MRSRRSLRFPALLALLAALFAQAALAVAACNSDGPPSRGAAIAMSAAAAGEAPCHEAVPANDALCTAHCQASDLSIDKYQVKVPVLAVLALPSTAVTVPVPPAAALPAPAFTAAAPPARILFKTLLI